MSKKLIKKSKVIVNKFGGGIMIRDYIYLALERVQEQIKKGYKPVIVVSALKGVTDELIAIFLKISELTKKIENSSNAESLIQESVKIIRAKHMDMIDFLDFKQEIYDKLLRKFDKIYDKLYNDLVTINRFGMLNIFQDRILSYGEKMSALLFANFLKNNGLNAKRYKAENIPIITDNTCLDANINYDISEKNVRKIDLGKNIPVIAGFTGKNKKGNTTTLGRGGTDTTACFIASAMRAEKVVLWKDVDGVLSADPRIVDGARTIDYLSYTEAEESGKVIHDKAIQYVKMFDIKLEVASILDPKKKTVVGPANKIDKGAKIVSFKENLCLLVITDGGVSNYGFLNKITEIFNVYKINMVLIRNTRDSLQIVVERNNELEKAIKSLEELNYDIIDQEVSMVMLIGSLNWDMVSEFNLSLAKKCRDPQIGAFPYKNCVRLEAIVKNDEMKKVMRELHKVFIRD